MFEVWFHLSRIYKWKSKFYFVFRAFCIWSRWSLKFEINSDFGSVTIFNG